MTMPKMLSIIIVLAILIIAIYAVWARATKDAPPVGTPQKPHDPQKPHHPHDPRKPHKPVPEVYLYDVGRYGVPVYAAAALARSLGAEVATLRQISDAQKAGAEWCHYGWVNAGTAAAPKLEAVYPMQSGVQGCGGAGLHGGHATTGSFGLTLFGIKPKQGAFPICAPNSGVCILPWNASKKQWSETQS